MTGLLSAILLLAPSGLHLFDHHREPPGPCCDTCGASSAQVQMLICTMRTHPNWRERDDAAHDLRKFDWKCHPEIGAALASTMVNDCHEEVREEAAESLAKLAPCQPDVHAALVRAENCDPDHATRKWARRALRNLDDHCDAPCSVCGPITASVSVPQMAPTSYVTPLPPIYGDPVPSGTSATIYPEGVPLAPNGYGAAPGTVIEPYGGGTYVPPVEVVPPVEILPPALPPSPSPFLPGASREDEDQDERLADEDPSPVRRTSTDRRTPVLIQLGRGLFGRGR